MATLRERKGSGDGDSIGEDARTRTREFNLFVDNTADDWYTKFVEKLPLRSKHPKDKQVHVIRHFNVGQQSPLGYIVAAEYGTRLNSGIVGLGEWLMRVASNTGSERIFKEIADPQNPTAPRQTVGPARYVLWTGEGQPPGGLFKAKTIDGLGLKTISLAQGEGINRPDGMDVVAGDTGIELRQTFTHMTAKTQRRAADFKKSVNANKFIQKEYPEGTLLFVDFTIDEQVGVFPNSRFETFLYDVTLQFVYNKEGHTPLKRFDTFVDEEGYESIVTTSDGIEVERSFRKYIPQDFGKLLGIFDA